ncbi:unnamed protein product [Kluyveromyces dobzhanskii CBS 2104]|uniref:WGS project CCBQ000000000 data, contig 00106 n=1 Tax=Kluyveromyces dobzhanskii CBS 2104 TaxID=1427455 RepID=A0A0A8L7Q4_9SACH|nr:unnamed protein product [Kluyveromyces dobzhanskii CBS 2104]
MDQLGQANVSSEELTRDSNYPDGRKRKVAKRACLACREKKIKCDGEANPGPGGGPGKCTNCLHSMTECKFVASNRGGRRIFTKPKQSSAPISVASDNQPALNNGSEKNVNNDGIIAKSNSESSAISSGISSRLSSVNTSQSMAPLREIGSATHITGLPTTNSLPVTISNIHDSHFNNGNALIQPPASVHGQQQLQNYSKHSRNITLPHFSLAKHGELPVEPHPLSGETGTVHHNESLQDHSGYRYSGNIADNTNPMVNVGRYPTNKILPHLMMAVNTNSPHNPINNNPPGPHQFHEGMYVQPFDRQLPSANSFVSHQPTVNTNSTLGYDQMIPPRSRSVINYTSSLQPISTRPGNVSNSADNSHNTFGITTGGFPSQIVSGPAPASYFSQANWNTTSQSDWQNETVKNPKLFPSSASAVPTPTKHFDLRGDFEVGGLKKTKRSQSDSAQNKWKPVKRNNVVADLSSTDDTDRGNVVESSPDSPVPKLKKNHPSRIRPSDSDTYKSSSEERQYNLEQPERKNLPHDCPDGTSILPPTHFTMKMVDLYYDYIHPNVRVLPSKAEMKQAVDSREKTSLIYAMIVCALPFRCTKGKTKLGEPDYPLTVSECFDRIETYWEELEFIETLQTLNLLVYRSRCFHMDSTSTVKHLEKLLKTIAYSNVVAQYGDNLKFKEFLDISTRKNIVQIKVLLMNLWTAFSHICWIRNTFHDYTLLRETLSELSGTDERMEDKIVPGSQLVFITEGKRVPFKHSGQALPDTEAPRDILGDSRMIYLKDLDKKQVIDDASCEIYQFYICSIFHDWKNHRICEVAASAKLQNFNMSIQNKLYELKDEKSLMLVNWDILNCLAQSKVITLELQGDVSDLDILDFDIFRSPSLNLTELDELSKIIALKIPSLQAPSVMHSFQAMFHLLDVVALIELAAGKNLSCSHNLSQTPHARFVQPNSSTQGPESESGERTRSSVSSSSMNSRGGEYRDRHEKSSVISDDKMNMWSKYPLAFIELLEFVLPKLVNYIVWLKFLKFVSFDGKCALIYANKCIPLDEADFNTLNLVACARRSLYFGDQTLSDEELYRKIALVMELAFIKQKFNVVSEFTKMISIHLSAHEEVVKRVDQVIQYVNYVVGFTF